MRKRGAGSFAVLTAVVIALLSGSVGIAHMPVVYAEENNENSGTDNVTDTGKPDGDIDNGNDDTDTDADNGNDDTDIDIEEAGLLLGRSMSTFILRSSRSVEPVDISVGDIGTLNSTLGQYTNGTPVNATLSGDISGAGSIQVNTGNVLTLYLNGHTLSGPSTMISVNGGSVVITGNGTLESTGLCTIMIDAGTVTIESGTVKAELSGGQVHTIHIKSGTLTVNGGNVSASGGEATGAILLEGGSVTITEGSSLNATVSTGYGYTCYATSSGNLTISGGNFSLNAPGGKCLLIGSNVTANVTGGSYSGNSGSIGVDTGMDSSVPPIGGWANSFYDKFQGGVLSDNTFYKENNFVYTNPTVSVASGTWNGTCKETRNLTTGSSYTFSGEGWTIEGDSTVYGSGSFCVPANGDYTFSR